MSRDFYFGVGEVIWKIEWDGILILKRDENNLWLGSNFLFSFKFFGRSFWIKLAKTFILMVWYGYQWDMSPYVW
jgi:hypothetical protein